MTAQPVSVIIPLAVGELSHRSLLPQLQALPAGSEVLLVQACLADAQAAPAGAACPDLPGLDVRIIHGPAGRGRQLNQGIAAARHRWLWLLHADSRLQADTLPALLRFVASGQRALGYFDLQFANDGPCWVRLNQCGAWLRSRWLGLPFGDQGYVIQRDVLEGLGGFGEQASFGEDHLLVWSAHHAAVPVVPLRASLQTSARKYARGGWLRVTAQHLIATWRQARQARQRPDTQ